jgi:hypothetical protein
MRYLPALSRLFVALCLTLGLSFVATAQAGMLASHHAMPTDTQEIGTTPALTVTPSAEDATTATAARRTLCVNSSWSLSDGPLTFEILDGLNRTVKRTTAPAIDDSTDILRLDATDLTPNTYTVRVLNAHGIELGRQRVVYRPR